jgi:hypothetical protein
MVRGSADEPSGKKTKISPLSRHLQIFLSSQFTAQICAPVQHMLRSGDVNQSNCLLLLFFYARAAAFLLVLEQEPTTLKCSARSCDDR